MDTAANNINPINTYSLNSALVKLLYHSRNRIFRPPELAPRTTQETAIGEPQKKESRKQNARQESGHSH